MRTDRRRPMQRIGWVLNLGIEGNLYASSWASIGLPGVWKSFGGGQEASD